VPRTVVQQSNSCPPPAIIQYNMSDYRYTKPLLLSEVITDRDNNDSKLNNIKDGIINIIDENKSSGIIHTASVYLRELASGGFISINDNEYYHPASLAKVPKLMAILRQSETTPGLLNKEIYVTQFPQESGVSKPRNQVFAPGKSIQIGKKYTIKELLYYTIVESDNNANLLLDNYWNENIFAQLFTDLGLTSPYSGPNQGLNYTLSASEYSRFMRVLYNATYLSNEDADYALSLLAQSEFKEGILKALPAGTMAAHKFGEYGHLSEDGEIIGNYELH
jgi:beta-lactamase class A